MTDEEIIAIADQVKWATGSLESDDLITFARLIAAKQREIDAALFDPDTEYHGFVVIGAIRGQK